MATGVKKYVDPALLTHIRFAAWGVIDVETLNREARRNYLKTVRAELSTRDYALVVGGVPGSLYYAIHSPVLEDGSTWKAQAHHNAWSEPAFKIVCREFLNREDPDHANPEPAGSAAAG